MGKRGPKPTFCRICGNSCRKGGWGLCGKHYERWRIHGDPMRVDRTPNWEAYKFLTEVAAKHRGQNCLPWPFARSDGYGFVQFEGQTMRAARAVCLVVHGPAPHKREAAHRCGNASCVNPKHIYWATSADNKADMVRHGTAWWVNEETKRRRLRAWRKSMGL